jgi:hypothetical protein
VTSKLVSELRNTGRSRHARIVSGARAVLQWARPLSSTSSVPTVRRLRACRGSVARRTVVSDPRSAFNHASRMMNSEACSSRAESVGSRPSSGGITRGTPEPALPDRSCTDSWSGPGSCEAAVPRVAGAGSARSPATAMFRRPSAAVGPCQAFCSDAFPDSRSRACRAPTTRAARVPAAARAVGAIHGRSRRYPYAWSKERRPGPVRATAAAATP